MHAAEPANPDLLIDSDHETERRRRRRRTKGGLSLNLTAMIDVTFLLLVYFMVATEFKLGEEVYKLDLPQRAVAAAADPFELDDEPLHIRVSSIGPGGLTYRIEIEGPYEQPRTFEELFEFLRQRQITPESLGGLFKPDHPIIVRPAPSARWAFAVEAFNAAARAEYTNISFAEPGGGR